MMSEADLSFCKQIPKVELHAHLNGSVSQATLKKLYNKHPQKQTLSFTEKDILLTGKASYEHAFKIFPMLHSLVLDIDCVKIITEDVIEEFYADNVLYLELRSTPKQLSTLISKKDYIDAIVGSIKKCTMARKDLIVTYLVSIDRGRSIKDAWENLNLAFEYAKVYPDIVVGVDFSGDPSKGTVHDFIPVLREVKANGLKLIIHVGEVKDEQENLLLLKLKPDRVGHAVFIHPSHGGSDVLLDHLTHDCRKLPIEICLSSNIIGGIVQSLDFHPIKMWYESTHPIVLCTDDKGLFGCNLSDEYFRAVQLLNLSTSDVWKLSEDSIQYICTSDDVKKTLYDIWKRYKEKLKLEL